jgi:hypothetical protein
MAGLNLFHQFSKLPRFDCCGDDHFSWVNDFASGVEFPSAGRIEWLPMRLFWVGDVG